jgi:hypothetical protein
MSIRKAIVNQETGEKQTGTVLEIVDAKEPTTQVTLEDGTIIRFRMTVAEILRLDEPGPDGKPAYQFNTQVTTIIHHPEEQADE